MPDTAEIVPPTHWKLACGKIEHKAGRADGHGLAELDGSGSRAGDGSAYCAVAHDSTTCRRPQIERRAGHGREGAGSFVGGRIPEVEVAGLEVNRAVVVDEVLIGGGGAGSGSDVDRSLVEQSAVAAAVEEGAAWPDIVRGAGSMVARTEFTLNVPPVWSIVP